MNRFDPRLGVALIAVFFVAVIVLSVIFAGRGVVRDDLERNIAIPDDLLMDLRFKVAYDDENIYWRFEWDAPNGSFYHDLFAYEDGEWVRYGESPVGSEEFGFYEDRMTFFVDDGSVPYFAQYGGFITAISDQMRFFTDEASEEEVEAVIGESDLRKWLPGTRTDFYDWTTVRSEEELEALTEAGYFLDLWHWRAHRSNPVGFADDTLVTWYRLSDEGTGPFATNWDSDLEQPNFMFDPDITGQYALRWERLVNREYTQDDYYYLSEDIAVPFDPDHDWQEGDVIPRRLLREPDGSRGDIFANGIWDQEMWHVDLMRALDTGNPQDDKILHHLGVYDVAFAVHRDATTARWHYVSNPLTLGLSRDADVEALRFDGDQPPWDDIEWTEIILFYPGQIAWDHLMSDAHAGYEEMQRRTAVEVAHTEEELARYAVESEFRSEIRTQWTWTTLSWAVFFLLGSWALIRVADSERGPWSRRRED